MRPEKGVSAMVVTYTVGGLSAVNAVAGAYSDDLPLIFISGAPNSNDHASDRILHHTIGKGRGGRERGKKGTKETIILKGVYHIEVPHCSTICLSLFPLYSVVWSRPLIDDLPPLLPRFP